MKTLFFYGTLRHIPLLETVLGRSAETLELREAELADHQVSTVENESFPTIAPLAGATATGVLVKGLDTEDCARLDFYEGGFEYDLVPVTLRDGAQADVYMSKPGRWTPEQPWSLQGWVAEHGESNGYAATEVMGYYGSKSREQVAVMYPRIRARAASRTRAANANNGPDVFDGRIEILSHKRPYSDFYLMDEFVLRHAQFDGTMTEVMDRAAIITSDATILLPYDPVRDRVMLVEQLRMGPLARGDRHAWQLEPIAGLIDAGETPQHAAHREAMEEAGLTLRSLENVGEMYSTPGYSTELHYYYVGIADLPDGTERTAGLASEGENIRSHVMAFDVLMDMLDNQRVANSPLAVVGYWLARHRERLRSA